MITERGQAVGSALVGVDPTGDEWFHNRPPALAEDPLGPGDPASSSGSNKAAVNEDYDAVVRERRDTIARREGVAPDRVPADAVTASGSGLDPHISPAYAELQVARVARVNGLSEAAVRDLVEQHTTGRGLGVLGDPVVNVLELNLDVRAR